MGVKTFPVIEVFGPTIQGEGALAGITTHFVRFGGCDYLCEWCDSLYAVLPQQVKANSEKLTGPEIIERLGEHVWGAWVTLSGGNPALLTLDDLIRDLHTNGWRVAVETQGSRWRDWLGEVDCLTVSPKAPSSNMATPEHDQETFDFMTRATEATEGKPRARVLKIVAFDDTDYEWAKAFIIAHPDWRPFLSAGTDPPLDGEEYGTTLERIGDRYRWLCEKVSRDPEMTEHTVCVLPQLHVIAWGHARAV